jgi:hypothetical protein
MNVNLKEKIAQIYARKGPERRQPLAHTASFSGVTDDQPGADYALIIDCVFGRGRARCWVLALA